MSKKPSWIWYIYFIIYCGVTAYQIEQFSDSNSKISTYYHILIAYNLSYIIHYLRNALSVILNALAVISFYLFLRQTRWLTNSFWRGFLGFRFLSDMTGRIYEIKTLKSLFYQDIGLGKDITLLVVMLVLPSYIALIKYILSDCWKGQQNVRPKAG